MLLDQIFIQNHIEADTDELGVELHNDDRFQYDHVLNTSEIPNPVACAFDLDDHYHSVTCSDLSHCLFKIRMLRYTTPQQF